MASFCFWVSEHHKRSNLNEPNTGDVSCERFTAGMCWENRRAVRHPSAARKALKHCEMRSFPPFVWFRFHTSRRCVSSDNVESFCRSSGGGTWLKQNKHTGKVWCSGSVQTEPVVMSTSCGVVSLCVFGRVDGTVALTRVCTVSWVLLFLECLSRLSRFAVVDDSFVFCDVFGNRWT